MNEKVSRAADALAESYTGDGVKIHHLDRRPLPSRTEAVRVLDALQELLFPGYTRAQGQTGARPRPHHSPCASAVRRAPLPGPRLRPSPPDGARRTKPECLPACASGPL